MSNLSKFLSRFSQAAVQRSYNYVEQIDLETLDIMTEGNITSVYAQIEGTDYYDTTIQYHSSLDRLTDTDCSCPVGYDCKHAAALARLFFESYIDQKIERNQPHSTSNTAKPALNPQYLEAESWLNHFKQHLAQNKQSNQSLAQKQLIFILNKRDHLNKIETWVHKVRRNKQGEIRDAASYYSYDNIINKRLKLTESERALFIQIYFYAKLNAPQSYLSHLDLSGIPLNQFKSILESGQVYWQQHQNPALQWSDVHYDLDFAWRDGIGPGTEKLDLYFVDAQQRRIQLKEIPHLLIFTTEPLCYIDTQQHLVGQLNSTYPIQMIDHLLKMPVMPVSLLSQFDQIVTTHADAKVLPQPKSLKEIITLQGQAQPILRFGTLAQFDQRANAANYALVEIEFAYQGGRVKASSSAPSFIGSDQNRTVRQQRDLKDEKKRILQLEKMLPSFKWAKQLDFIKRSKLDPMTLENVICAHPQEWVANLLPINQFESIGWKVEHTAQSQFNLQSAQNLQFSLNESTKNHDWFEVGVTVQDDQGNHYNLIDLLATIVQQVPQLLDAAYIDQLDDKRFFRLTVRADQPQLALSIKDLKPIFLYLREILQQPEARQIDRYDASQLLDLQHHLGMQWQSNQRLKDFAEQLKQGYQQRLPTPQGFQGELRPYQQQGLAWLQFLRSTEHGGILADDMGLGKTAQTLAHILLEKQAGRLQHKPALIIAPTSLMQNWFKEAKKFTPDLKVLVLQGPQRHQLFEQIPEYDIVLSTYPLMSRDEEHLAHYQFHLLILDEAQNIKNPRAKAAQVVRQLPATHRLCLTGTPMENHLGELWSLFYFLMPGFLYQQDVFNKKYRHPIEKQADNQKRNKLVARIQPFMLRRLKTEVAKELPPKTTIQVDIEMNDQQAKLYEAVRATMQSNIRQIIAEKGFNRSQIQILDALLKLRQVCCHPSLLKLDSFKSQQAESAKLDHLLSMVKEMVEEGRRILIFSQFTSMLQLIEEGLQAQNIQFVKLTGQTKKRDLAIDAFQSGQVPVFLISLKAGGVGLNLTAADTVIHYDPWWNPAAEDQASDRAWRIGQDKPVFVYKLITSQSIEEKIILMQQAKAQLAQSILSVDHENEVKFSEGDVMNLLESF